MNVGRTVFSQLLSFLPDREFRRCVERYGGDRRPRGFSHMGFHGKVARSTPADANESHDWRIFAGFAHILIGIARPLYAHDPIGVDIDESLYALDSTTIDPCLSLFPWAKFRKHKAAVKMHTLLDLRGSIPTFIRITDGKVHDVNILDEILPEAGAFYVVEWTRRLAGVLRGVAAEREAQGGADLAHAMRAEVRHPLSQALPRHGHRVVEIDRTAALHAVTLVEHDLGRHPANGGGDGRHRDGRQVVNGAGAG